MVAQVQPGSLSVVVRVVGVVGVVGEGVASVVPVWKIIVGTLNVSLSQYCLHTHVL